MQEVHKSLDNYYKGSYRRFSKELDRNIDRLKLFPYMYQKLESLEELRRFFIQNYVVIYKTENNIIKLIRILPSKLNYIQEGINKNKFPKHEIKI